MLAVCCKRWTRIGSCCYIGLRHGKRSVGVKTAVLLCCRLITWAISLCCQVSGCCIYCFGWHLYYYCFLFSISTRLWHGIDRGSVMLPASSGTPAPSSVLVAVFGSSSISSVSCFPSYILPREICPKTGFSVWRVSAGLPGFFFCFLF